MNTTNKLYQSITGLALATGLLLLIPLLAMQFSNQIVWSPFDFLVAGTLLFGTGLTYILVTKKTDSIIYRITLGFALFTGLFLIWVNLAVGIVGSENNPANLMYFGVLAVGIIGAFTSRCRPHGMSLTMFAMALAQALVAIVILIGGLYQTPPSTVLHILGVNGFFILLFLLSALLFRRAIHEGNGPGGQNMG